MIKITDADYKTMKDEIDVLKNRIKELEIGQAVFDKRAINMEIQLDKIANISVSSYNAHKFIGTAGGFKTL